MMRMIPKKNAINAKIITVCSCSYLNQLFPIWWFAQTFVALTLLLIRKGMRNPHRLFQVPFLLLPVVAW